MTQVLPFYLVTHVTPVFAHSHPTSECIRLRNSKADDRQNCANNERLNTRLQLCLH